MSGGGESNSPLGRGRRRICIIYGSLFLSFQKKSAKFKHGWQMSTYFKRLFSPNKFRENYRESCFFTNLFLCLPSFPPFFFPSMEEVNFSVSVSAAFSLFALKFQRKSKKVFFFFLLLFFHAINGSLTLKTFSLIFLFKKKKKCCMINLFLLFCRRRNKIQDFSKKKGGKSAWNEFSLDNIF